MNQAKISIFSCTHKAFVQKVYDRLGKGNRHAALLYRQWFKEGKMDPKVLAEPQAERLVQEMIGLIDVALPEVISEQREGETVKFLLKFPDGMVVESVLISMQAGITLCLSSQVGCKRGCAFCETGRMGLLRSLTVEEIIVQVFVARFVFQTPLRNIVFMGMGEPFDNYDNVMKAIAILTDPGGWEWGPSRLTVSTSGCVEEIDRFTKDADPAVNLAVSIHAPTNNLRNRLMPVNRKWDLMQLKKSLQQYCQHPRREILIEYILLKGINDKVEQADELAEYLQGLRVKVNLIPYNSQRRSRFESSDETVQEAFLQRLREKGYQVLLRRHRGRGIMAACGQLGTRENRRYPIMQQKECTQG